MARGGKRPNAGRPTGSAWKPAAKQLRADAFEKAGAIVTGGEDPLTTVAGWVVNPDLDLNFRLSAANACLPFLFPRLAATQVNSNLTVTKIDSADLLRKLEERMVRVARPVTLDAKPEEPPLAIEITPDDEADFA